MKCHKTLMKMGLLGVLGLSGLLIATSSVSAQESKAMPVTEASNWGFSFHIEQAKLDPVVAKRIGLHDTATVLGMAGERRMNDNSMSVVTGLNIYLYNDNAGFTQNTTKGVKESSASGGSFFVEYGPKIHLGDDNKFHLIAHAGYNAMISANRTIDDCSNCHSESIKLRGGPYALAGVGFNYGSVDWGLQFVKNFSGDVKNSVRLRISSSF